MIWFDITDPKYVLFFRSLIPHLKTLTNVIITSRESADYNECARLLRLFNIPFYAIGSYGGAKRIDKLKARLKRQDGFLKLFKMIGIPKLFITGASVEGVHTAYGLGMPIIQFADTPVANEHFTLQDVTVLSRLTLPLSNMVFRPFIVPEICYTSLGLAPNQVIAYHFIDVALWLSGINDFSDFRINNQTSQIQQDRVRFCKQHGFNPHLPIILVREEEYKAHYVKKQLPLIYEAIDSIAKTYQINMLIIPRYDKKRLEEILKHIISPKANVCILSSTLMPNVFYPHIDIMLGGGGTMNLESCFLGIPTISTRSLLLFHDRYLIDSNLMSHCVNVDEILKTVRKIISKPCKKGIQNAIFTPQKASFRQILSHIKALYQSLD